MMMMINLALKSKKLQINTMNIHATIECISNTKWSSTKIKSFENLFPNVTWAKIKFFLKRKLKLDVSPMKLSTSFLC
jgi:hypothetical protein